MLRNLMVMFVMLAAVGCGDKGPGLVPVTGKITYGGGAWPKTGYVNFSSIEPAAGYPTLNGTAELNTDGTFTVKSSGDKFGLVPGKYAVSLEAWEETPNMETNPPSVGKSYIPEGFKAPEVEIAVGDSKKEVNFDVPKK